MAHTPDPTSTFTPHLELEKARKLTFRGSWADLVNDNLDLLDAAGAKGHAAIVYLDGATVAARDQFGGAIDSGTAGTDDGTVIQAALDAATAGTCHLGAGSYTLFEPLTVPTGVTLSSNPHPVYSSEATYYTAMLAADATFTGGTDTGGIVELANRSGISGVRVKGIGGASGINGISAANVRSVLVQGCRVTNCYRGLQATGLLGGQILDSEFRSNGHAGISGAAGFTDTLISRCFFPVNYEADILLGSGGIKVQIADCTFEWGSAEGVRLAGCSLVSITGNHFDRKAREAIYLDSCDHITVAANCFRRSAAVSRDAHLYAADSQFTVVGNEYMAADTIDGAEVGTTVPNYVYEIGAGCTVAYLESPAAQAIGVHKNANCRASNIGTSTGTGSEQTIAHDLSATPSRVSVVPTETGATVSAVWADATNLHATVTSGKAYAWSAEV